MNYIPRPPTEPKTALEHLSGIPTELTVFHCVAAFFDSDFTDAFYEFVRKTGAGQRQRCLTCDVGLGALPAAFVLVKRHDDGKPLRPLVSGI